MRPDDGDVGEGGVWAVDGEAIQSTATEADLNGSRSSKSKTTKGKGGKKSKGKSGKVSGSSVSVTTTPSVAAESSEPGDRRNGSGDGEATSAVVDIDVDTASSVTTDSVGTGPVVTGSVAAEPMATDSVASDPAADPLVADPVISDHVRGGDEPETDGIGGPTVTSSSTRRQGARSNIALLSTGVVVVALAVALALSLSALGNQDALGSSRISALSAARTYAVQLASYDYDHLNRDFAAVAANSTPSFRRSFTQSSDALKSTLTRYKATAAATVVSAGLVSASTSRAVALVLLDQKIANSTQATPTTDRSQVEITLVSSGGRWLIDQVTLL